MSAFRFSSILMLVFAAAAATLGVAYWVQGALGLGGGLFIAIAALVFLRLAFGRGR
ncbi:hypothetical protein U879_12735 [Defluviimonas sp. 20V17]|uniref:Uncharacterized protein n=1 Tax=Allgaiera indica TaxID=765699 RepID=A0AAN4UPX8_9RHOB|nr:hypothetical protein [Allgaiera indica]KDB03307.1 hypothetical protein U879_12735 [Defluviimonas sp. 20V17]GHE00528.1 hypothetical protein GCM10008024_12390 [Allgaiera indica]SDW60365.1 hypothetical protein SAMN05444006_10577 [Allgaiera indica]